MDTTNKRTIDDWDTDYIDIGEDDTYADVLDDVFDMWWKDPTGRWHYTAA